jgi:hypothetical protein
VQEDELVDAEWQSLAQFEANPFPQTIPLLGQVCNYPTCCLHEHILVPDGVCLTNSKCGHVNHSASGMQIVERCSAYARGVYPGLKIEKFPVPSRQREDILMYGSNSSQPVSGL